MKKLITILLPLLLGAGALVATSGAPAHADPYPGTVKTTCQIVAKDLVRQGRRGVGSAFVSVSGNARPVGRVIVVVKRVKGGAYFRLKDDYDGRTVPFVTQRLTKRGLYTARMTFHAMSGSVYKDCASITKFRVTRRG